MSADAVHYVLVHSWAVFSNLTPKSLARYNKTHDTKLYHSIKKVSGKTSPCDESHPDDFVNENRRSS